MTVSSAINSFFAPDSAGSTRARQHRSDGFDRQLQSSVPGRVAQAASRAGAASTPTGAGHLLSSDLLRQIQALPGVAAATPTGR